RLTRRGNKDVIRTSRLISRLVPVSDSPDLSEGVIEQFSGPGQRTVDSSHSLTKAALVYLSNIRFAGSSFEQIIEKAKEIQGSSSTRTTSEDIEKVGTFFLEQFEIDAIVQERFQAKFSGEAGERPTASRFARWQIAHGVNHITALTGMNVNLDNNLAQ